MGDPDVTVVVCTRNRPLQLEHCLDSLKLQSHPRFDILVVDSASMPPVRELCRRYGVRYVYEPVAGTNRARNIGAQLARGDVIAYIDDDAIAEADWLAMLVREFAEPVVAAVCGKYRYMKIYGDPAALDGDESTEGIVARPRGTFTRQTRDWFALACFGGIGEGSNMAFRRALIVHPHGFDERLGRGRLLSGGEESVMFVSLIERGHCIVRAPEAVIRHPYPAVPAQQLTLRLRDLRTSVAFVLFLWFEFPGHHADILHHLGRAMRRRLMRSGTVHPAPIRLPRWQALRAAFGGLCLYWKARREMDRLC